MDLQNELRRLGGAVRTKTLLARTGSPSTLRRAIGRGEIQSPGRGVVALADAPPGYVQALLAGGVLTCASAAQFHGLWLLSAPASLHVAVGNGRHGSATAHRLPLAHPPVGPPVAALGDVLVHALFCLPPLEALVMVESAVNTGLMHPDYLRRRVSGNRGGAARAVVERVERGSDSPLETVARVLFRGLGCTVRTQVQIEGVGIVDFLLEERLIIEIDGLEFHLERRQFKKDRRRDNAACEAGFLVLRYTYEDVIHRPEQMVAQVERVLWERLR